MKIGIVGTGNIAVCHRQAYETAGAEVVAVADTADGRAARIAADWGVRRSYQDPAELFADDDVDAVSICTPNHTHASLAVDAIAAGKHVLVEKPMGRTYAEAVELQQAADKSDRVVQVGMVRRHATNCRALKSYLDAGMLGPIYYAKASCLQRLANPGGWFASKKLSGGGPVMDFGVHMIDLAWYLMGTPEVVTVSANTYDRLGARNNIWGQDRYRAADAGAGGNDVEDLANALIRFSNGASLAVDVSYSLHATSDRLGISVFGEKGGADLEPLRVATELADTMVNIDPVLSSTGFNLTDGFANQAKSFLAACRGETESAVPASQGAELLKILDMVYHSAANGREVAAE
ncbi:Gfo/Idh/MocA family protein [Kribbella sp. GL6]|uniref:Gfo/Idh/MocA family protein n=1 Tax=Kribbella sp. GL6 TaxID=3419765 RepID=UPI003CFF98D3